MNKNNIFLLLLMFCTNSIYAINFNAIINKEVNNYKDSSEKEDNSNTPLFDDIKCSNTYCLGLKNGSVWFTGEDQTGGFGVGGKIKETKKWTQTDKNNVAYSNVDEIFVTIDGSSFIKKGSVIYGTGENSYGILGTNDTKNHNSWSILKDDYNNEIRDVIHFSSVSKYSAYLERKDGLYYSGSSLNPFGITLKYKKFSNLHVDKLVSGIHFVAKINDKVYTSGYNASGSLGNGTTESTSKIAYYGEASSNVNNVFSDPHYTFLIKNNSLYAAGSNEKNFISDSPVNTAQYTFMTNEFEQYKVGYNIIVAIKDNTLYFKGRNNEGQFGKPFDQNDQGKWIKSIKVNSLDDVFITNGMTTFIKKDGKLYASGKNTHHQLGIDHNGNIHTWTEVK